MRMKSQSENEEILLEWYHLTGLVYESDKGNATGNVVSTPSGNSGKSSSFSHARTQGGSESINKETNTGDNKDVNKDGKDTGTKNYKTLSTDKEKEVTKNLEKNKEITKSIEKLNKPRDIASFLQGILQTAVKDGNAKEQEVKNAVSLFARETLKK